MDFELLSTLAGELTSLEDSVSELFAKGEIEEATKISKRIADLKPVVEAYSRYENAKGEVASAKEFLITETDNEMREFFNDEIEEKKKLSWSKLTDTIFEVANSK